MNKQELKEYIDTIDFSKNNYARAFGLICGVNNCTPFLTEYETLKYGIEYLEQKLKGETHEK